MNNKLFELIEKDGIQSAWEAVARLNWATFKAEVGGVVGTDIRTQECLDAAVARAKDCAAELEKIAIRIQNGRCKPANVEQARYIVSLLFKMAGEDMDDVVKRAKTKAGGGFGGQIAIDGDTLSSLKKSWEVIKRRYQDIFAAEYDQKNEKFTKAYPHVRINSEPLCDIIDELLEKDEDGQFGEIFEKVYVANYGKRLRRTKTEEVKEGS